MNDHWDCLGIEPTDDLATIKRAYARALKLNRPEDDADAYQRLREAYDWAQQFARWAKANPGWREEDEDPDEDVSETDEAAAQSDLDSPTSSHETRPPPEHEVQIAVSPPDHRAWWQRVGVDPVAVLMPHDRVLLMGEGAAEPLIFVSVLGQAATTLVPRWHRHVVPEHEATWADPIYGFDDLHTADANDVLDVLAHWRDADDPNEDRSEALVHLLHQLPLREQDEVQVRCAGFVLEQSDLPPRLVLTLANCFDWGRDFRLEQLIGEDDALALYERIERAREDLAELGPRGLRAAQARLSRLLDSARAHAEKRYATFWARLLLSPVAHYRDLKAPDAAVVLSVAELPVRPLSSAVRAVFFVCLLAVAALIGLMHGVDGVIHALGAGTALEPRLTYPLLLLGWGALGYYMMAEWPLPGLVGIFSRLGGTRPGEWLAQQRHQRVTYWLWLAYLLILTVGLTVPYDVMQRDDVAMDPGVWIAISALFSALPLLALWPRDEAWEPLYLPMWGMFSAVLGANTSLGWLISLPIAAAWIVLAELVAVRHAALADRVVNGFFGLIRPTGFRWVLFFVFIKGVVVFYTVLVLITPPLWLCVYARDAGWQKVWLAMMIAFGLWGTGLLALDGFSFMVWLMVTLFAMTRLDRLIANTLDTRALGAA